LAAIYAADVLRLYTKKSFPLIVEPSPLLLQKKCPPAEVNDVTPLNTTKNDAVFEELSYCAIYANLAEVPNLTVFKLFMLFPDTFVVTVPVGVPILPLFDVSIPLFAHVETFVPDVVAKEVVSEASNQYSILVELGKDIAVNTVAELLLSREEPPELFAVTDA
jgi:hypothetical protein